MKLADAYTVDVGKLSMDMVVDLIDDEDCQQAREATLKAIATSHTQTQMAPVLLDDEVPGRPPQPLPSKGAGNPGSAPMPPAVMDSDEPRSCRLFPNSFKITGLKHICDNLQSSVLSSLNMRLGLATERWVR